MIISTCVVNVGDAKCDDIDLLLVLMLYARAIALVVLTVTMISQSQTKKMPMVEGENARSRTTTVPLMVAVVAKQEVDGSWPGPGACSISFLDSSIQLVTHLITCIQLYMCHCICMSHGSTCDPRDFQDITNTNTNAYEYVYEYDYEYEYE